MHIRVKVFPESRRERVEVVREGSYHVYVRPKAEGGAANARLVELMNEHFPGNRGIRILRGLTRPQKHLEIIEPVDALF